MSKFKALLKKDWFLSKKHLFLPIWITAGFYVLILITMLIGYLKGGLQLNWSDFNISDVAPVYAISYIANLSMMALPAFLGIIVTIILTQSALNEDVRRNSELFHRSQPVSIWLSTLSKYVTGIAGNWMILFIITLFNFLVVNIILAAVGQFVLYVAFSGMIQAFIGFMKVTLVIGSLCYFCSAVFKDKAFLLGLSILLGVQFLFFIINILLGWNLPLPLTYLKDLLSHSNIMKIESGVTQSEIIHLINRNWQELILSWKTLVQIIFSGALFAGATLIYKNREIK